MQSKRTTAFRRSVPVAVLAGLMAFTAPLTTMTAYADNTSQELQSELSAAKSRLDELSSRLEYAAAVVDDTEYQLEETTTEIESLKDEIQDKKQKVSVAQADLAATATESYKGGDLSLLDLILSSSSFSELTSRLFYANKIADKNSAKIAEVNSLITTLNEKQDELAKKEKQLTSLLEEQKASEKELEDSRAEAQSYVNGLSSELQAALKAEREAEAARQKAELEAQQQQQQQGGSGSQQGSGDSGNGGGSTGGGSTGGGSTSGGSTGGGATGGDTGGNTGGLSAAARSTIVAAARSQLGVAYDLGACIPGVAMDCSGLTSYSYRQAGISISRSSRSQYSDVVRAGNLKTSAGALTAGDLVFYQSGGVIYHVAIYIGGGDVCHANGYGQGVVITDIFYDAGFCGGGSPV